MLKVFGNRKFLFRILVSYLLIFICTLVLMTTILYRVSVVNLQREIENSNMYKLTQLKDSLDIEMKALGLLAAKINFDTKLTPYIMTGNGYNIIEGISQISFHRSSNALIQDCFIYYKDNRMIYSSSGLLSVNTLTDYYYVFDKTKKDSFIDKLNTIKNPVFIGAENVNFYNSSPTEILTYLYPISYAGNDPYGVVIFFIRKSSFDKKIENLIGVLKGSTLILDKNNNILVSTSKTFQLTDNVIAKINENDTEGIRSIIVEDSKLSLISVTSESTGWKFVVIIPTSQYLEKVINIKYLVFQISIIVFALGLMIVIFTAGSNYKPIGKLLGSLQEQLDIQQPLVKERLLSKILKGDMINEEVLLALLKDAQIKLTGPFYLIMLIKQTNETSTTSEAFRLRVSSSVQQNFSKDSIAFAVDLIHSSQIAIIINMDEDDDQVRFKLASHIKQGLETDLGEKIMVGVGKTCNSVGQLSRSFIEALSAIEGNMLYEDRDIVFYDDTISSEKSVYWYPAEEQQRYIRSIKLGDKTAALHALDNITKSILEKASSVLIIKYVCYDMVNAVIKTLNEMEVNDFDNEVAALMNFLSIKELNEKLRVLTSGICDFTGALKKVKEMKLGTHIIKFVDNNYDKQNISLDNVAETFNLSVYYLSRFFKEQTTQNFTDYITNLKMLKAKKLLSETDMQIKEIVIDIGYTDSSYFTKKFKMLEGITPGQFRELYRKNKFNGDSST